MQLPPDFREFIELLNGNSVRYVIVGGWVYNLYAPPRMTGDIDFFIAIDPDNEKRLRQTLSDFGFGGQLPPQELEWLQPEKVIMLGREPWRIDIICKIDGVDFDEAWNSRKLLEIDGLQVPTLALELLLRNKAAAGRDKDLLDLKVLSKLLPPRSDA